MAERAIILTTSLCLLALLLSVSARPQNDHFMFRNSEAASPIEEESLPNEDPATLDAEVLQHTKSATYNEDELESESNPLSRRQVSETVQEVSETTSDALDGVQNQVNEVSVQPTDAVNNQLSEGINVVSTLATDVSNQLNEASTQGLNQLNEVSGQISNGVSDIATQANEGISQASTQASEGIPNTINTQIDAITDQVHTGVDTVSGQLSQGIQGAKQPAEQMSNQLHQITDQVHQGVDSVSAQISQGIKGFNGQLPPIPSGLGPQGFGFSAQGFNGQRPPMPPNMGPQQIQQLREFLSLEVNNKEKFAEIFARMTPEQVRRIREIVLQIGQQTGNQDLIRFGQCRSPRFDDRAVQVLLSLGKATFDRLNAVTTGAANFLNRAGTNLVNNVDPRQVFEQIKLQIGSEQDFIRRLVNMIELQLSRAPQIDNEEFAEIKQITARIKQLSGQVQTQLGQATDVSQLSQMGNTLLEIQRLSSKIQQKISAELLEEKMKELANAAGNADQTTAGASGSAGNSAAVQVQTTETN
ncbi:hypothetical protein WDU94_001078 [Cyamophila willieti]